MSIARHVFSCCALASLSVAAGFAAGCGSNGDPNAGLTSGAGPGALFGTTSGDGSVNAPRCIVATKQCVATCNSASTTTSISGTVYDPAGKNPLYGVVVFVPSTPPAALPAGAGCYSCGELYDSGNPIANTVTDADGKFTLTGVPDGANIPLVLQVGKWRMQYTMPNVSQCQDNDAKVAAAGIAAPNVLRLPRNHMEGDIPNIAVATGGADSLECLLSRIGVDKSEYVAGPGGAGRIHIFQGDGGSNTTPGAPVASTGLWPNNTTTAVADMMPYDITLLTCEGHETTGSGGGGFGGRGGGGGGAGSLRRSSRGSTITPRRAAASSRRTSTTHGSTPDRSRRTTSRPGRRRRRATTPTPTRTSKRRSPAAEPFPRGQAMKDWLTNVNALTANGELHIVQARHNAVVTAANTASLPWIVTDTKAQPPNQTEYFSFDTPFGVSPTEQCGRVVYSDLHVGAASGDYGQTPDQQQIPGGAMVPSGCANNALSPQEKALEFMLFDLSGCITPPDQGAGGVTPK